MFIHQRRPPNAIVVEALDASLKVKDDPIQFWSRFYEFVVASYGVPFEERYSVSALARIFRDANIPSPGQVAVTYAHCLYVLAVADGQPIHKTGFNP